MPYNQLSHYHQFHQHQLLAKDKYIHKNAKQPLVQPNVMLNIADTFTTLVDSKSMNMKASRDAVTVLATGTKLQASRLPILYLIMIIVQMCQQAHNPIYRFAHQATQQSLDECTFKKADLSLNITFLILFTNYILIYSLINKHA